ncbi:Qat anti-phage system QueC-like protein QatC [Vibrio coralliilyticus]|uniref:Qat anti-phage system QueC-like protein QatC n=1 Tax=Vibrio coralliilyticus TaxID=190893 RepID=UPI000C1732F2|nr:Qat anti-phage system QueC-like protein QatC [Vibrio coralliilyticus]
MKLNCTPTKSGFSSEYDTLNVLLFGKADADKHGFAGAAVYEAIKKQKLAPCTKAWDLLSIALSVICADLAGHRKKSPDGWTRSFEVDIAVNDSTFWNLHAEKLQSLLSFLTTDIWRLNFIDGGFNPISAEDKQLPDEDCVALLSGGLDSLIGNIDLVTNGHLPFVVTQTVRGDGYQQKTFAASIGDGLRQFKANHNATVPKPETPSSQRARSIIFLAYGVLIATSLRKYHEGEEVKLYVCENGFISINPPLTQIRLGSLSTRTTHPVVLSLFQEILNDAGIRVLVENPYKHKTKGEMLRECADQSKLKQLAPDTTSCGRYLIHGHQHCGRCVPCMVRRAAFNAWNQKDLTIYKYHNLGIKNDEHSGYDDVRSALIAIYERREKGTKRWLSSALSSPRIQSKEDLAHMIERGLEEIEALLIKLNAK